MVHFDTTRKVLTFSHVHGREGKTPFVAEDVSIDLSKLDELSRQLVILTAKLSSAHSAGQKVSLPASQPTDKDGKHPKPVQVKLVDVIHRLAHLREPSAEKPHPDVKSVPV